MPGIPPTPNNIPLAASLPKVSFRKIPPEEAFVLHVPAGVLETQMVGFGFNDGSPFEKPGHYIRYVEPIESELKKQVEYDMDEQDQEWLEVLNLERRKDGLDAISYETFETILDQLEKEWFDLIQRIPPKVRPAHDDDQEAGSEDGEDSKCAICDDGECENSNAIVFCDGCNLAVHQDCYGIPYIPEGQWLCRKCTVSPDRAVSCILCPHEGGAFKQTTTGKWAHLICAMWIPETGVSNPVYMEPIDSIDRIPKARWRLQCYLCRHKTGACIQCDNKSCFTAFHVTCARKAGLLFKTERVRALSHQPSADSDNSDDEAADVLRACCHKHIPSKMRDQLKINFRRHSEDASEGSIRGSPFAVPRTRETSIETGAPLISVSRRSSIGNNRKRLSKSARAYKKSFKPGPPLVPAYIANRVLEYISKISLRKKAVAVQLIAKYWSLKREARRGAPLLKRLHLEPWTASTQNKEQTDAQKAKKLLFLRSLREDLERVRMLTEQVRKRERDKLRQAQEIRTSLVNLVLFPYHDDLRAVLAKLEAVDKFGFFTAPVSKIDVPDYYDIIKEPMDWNTVRQKIDESRYDSIHEVRQDVLRISNNAMIYNKPDTPYHKVATKVLKLIPEVFDQLEKVDSAHSLELKQDLLRSRSDQEADETLGAVQLDPAILEDVSKLGLEAPMSVINLLRDYAAMDVDERTDLRHTAYQDRSPPPIAQPEHEEALQDDDERVHSQARGDRQVSPVLNLVDDFVSQIYVPQPLPETKKGSKKSSPTMSPTVETAKPSARKQIKKRKIVSEATPVGERRSSRRRQDDVAGVSTTDDTPVVKRLKREDAKPASKPSPAVEAALASDEPAKVEGGVGDHDSFLLFNSGWVYPEGAKRNRGTPLKPMSSIQRPRKGSAPESSANTASQTAATNTPARPRATTIASPSHRGTRASSQSKAIPARTTRRRALDSLGSSPLTSDDEAKETKSEEKQVQQDADQSLSAREQYNLARRQKRAQEREERLAREAQTTPKVEEQPKPDAVVASASPARRSGRTRSSETPVQTEEDAELADTGSPGADNTPSKLRQGVKIASPKKKDPNRVRALRGPVGNSDEAVYKHGTDVWAKMEGHPYFPAMVISDRSKLTDEQISARPEQAPPLRPTASGTPVKQTAEVATPSRASRSSAASSSPQIPKVGDTSAPPTWILVAFYDNTKTWRWLPSHKVMPMLVDEEIDSKMLKAPGKSNARKKVKKAYEQAKQQ